MSAFSIYDILNKDDDPSLEEQANVVVQEEDSENDDDEFNIDASLDSDDSDNDNDTGDNGGDLSIPSDNAGATASDDEPVKSNTELFDSLSAEEQQMKIVELKHQYAELFNSCDDMIDKLSTIESTEITMVAVSRIVNMLMNLKDYITDYLYNRFSSNSYYENDVYFNRFLAIFKSISNILNDIFNYNSQK